jgi:hypothetical protein
MCVQPAVVPRGGECESYSSPTEQDHESAPWKLLKIDHQIIAVSGNSPICRKLLAEMGQIALVQDFNLGDERIVVKDGSTFFFRKKINCGIWKFFFEHLRNMACQNDITDLSELTNKYPFGMYI